MPASQPRVRDHTWTRGAGKRGAPPHGPPAGNRPDLRRTGPHHDRPRNTKSICSPHTQRCAMCSRRPPCPPAPCLPGPEHEPLSEQRLAIGRGTTSAPARRPGRRTRLERGLDGGGDESRGLLIDDDVPAEQNAADDLPGMRGRVMRADGGGLGHTRTVEETVLVRLPDTPDLQRLLRRSPGGACPVRGSAGDRVANRSVLDRPDTVSATGRGDGLCCIRCRPFGGTTWCLEFGGKACAHCSGCITGR
jgi:hypothetical protein